MIGWFLILIRSLQERNGVLLQIFIYLCCNTLFEHHTCLGNVKHHMTYSSPDLWHNHIIAEKVRLCEVISRRGHQLKTSKFFYLFQFPDYYDQNEDVYGWILYPHRNRAFVLKNISLDSEYDNDSSKESLHAKIIHYWHTHFQWSLKVSKSTTMLVMLHYPIERQCSLPDV